MWKCQIKCIISKLLNIVLAVVLIRVFPSTGDGSGFSIYCTSNSGK